MHTLLTQHLTPIFDMDGLLLDTEPIWGESMWMAIEKYDLNITKELFVFTRGLRVYEVTKFWELNYGIPKSLTSIQLADEILENVITLSLEKATIMPGVIEVLDWFKQQGVQIGVATSSPYKMMIPLLTHFELQKYFNVLTTADTCALGKPHPEVYLQCAASLGVNAAQCIAFEDSINGMVAAKAARMYCVVVPEEIKYSDPAFGLADLKVEKISEILYL